MDSYNFVRQANGTVCQYLGDSLFHSFFNASVQRTRNVLGNDTGFEITDIDGYRQLVSVTTEIKHNGQLIAGSLTDKINYLRKLVFFKNGNINQGYKTINGDYTTLDEDYTIEIKGGTYSVTVLSAVDRKEKEQQFIHTGTDPVILLGDNNETLGGQTNITLFPGHGITLKSTGVNYIITSMY